MKVRLSGRAEREVVRTHRWWVAHRDARELFLDELAEAQAQLMESPEAGVAWRVRGGGVVRRWLLPKTKYHLYYRLESDKQTVRVLAVWSAIRARPPKTLLIGDAPVTPLAASGVFGSQESSGAPGANLCSILRGSFRRGRLVDDTESVCQVEVMASRRSRWLFRST